MQIELKGVIAEHVRAVNAFDTDAIMSTFAKDAYVNDNRREIGGSSDLAVGGEEIVGDRVTLDVREVIDHYATSSSGRPMTASTTRPTFPRWLMMTNYFSVRDGKIVSLAIIFNQPTP